MKIFKTLLLALIIIGAGTKITFAKSDTLTQKQLERYKPLKADEGRALMSLRKAKLSDVNLPKPVKYFDIKSYEIIFDNLKYTGGWSFDRVAYSKLSDREKRRIRSVKPVKSSSPFGATYFADSPMKEIYNLHYVDMHSKVHTFASRKELLAFLGVIDTPAEVHMALLNRYGEIRYKKMGNLYIIREKSVMHEDYDGGDYDCYLDIVHKIMDNRGNMLLIKGMKHQGYRGKKCDSL